MKLEYNGLFEYNREVAYCDHGDIFFSAFAEIDRRCGATKIYDITHFFRYENYVLVVHDYLFKFCHNSNILLEFNEKLKIESKSDVYRIFDKLKKMVVFS